LQAEVEKFIRVGAVGWQHEHWLDGFYPDDLPEDWRLSYYANEFSTVLLVEAVWRSNVARLEEWAGEVPEGFRFYLQASELSFLELENIRQKLGNKFGGILDGASGAVMIQLSGKSLRGWREWLEQNGSGLNALFMVDENLSVKQMSEFKSLVEMLNL
jgi:hypothetical protein